MQETIAEQVQTSKQKDDIRGEKIIPDYKDVHPPAAENSFVKDFWKETKAIQAEITVLKEKIASKAGASGLGLSLPVDRVDEITRAVIELRFIYPVTMIMKDNPKEKVYGLCPTYDNEGLSYTLPGSKNILRIKYEDLAYHGLGKSIKTFAAKKKVLIVANEIQLARQKKTEILSLDMDFKPDNIWIAVSREQIQKSLKQAGEFDFVIKVTGSRGAIWYSLENLNLPGISMDYTANVFELQMRLENAALASSV